MKRKILKIMAFALTFMLALSVIILPASAAPYKTGDVNGDGMINSNDAIYLLRHTLMPDNYPLACNHDLTEHEGKAPTCSEEGYEAYSGCTLCKYTTQREVIPATGNHTYEYGVCTYCGYGRWDGTPDISWYTNQETEYFIKSPQELAGLAQLVNHGSYLGEPITLTADIDLGGNEWAPIGNSPYSFNGIFNGNGFTVSNFKITVAANAANYLGLFGLNAGEIKNLAVDSFAIDVTVNEELENFTIYAGGLVGLNNSGTVANCSASGNVTVTSVNAKTRAGGLVGWNYKGTIANSKADCAVSSSSVSGLDYAGGFAGQNSGNGIITDCTASGEVKAHADSTAPIVGGLVGYNLDSVITECTASGDTYASSVNSDKSGTHGPSVTSGGLVGSNTNSSITDCTATGNVYATSESSVTHAGGLAGRNLGIITNSSASGDVYAESKTASAYAGGLVGYNYLGTITDCSASGDATATSENSPATAGGLVGIGISIGTITNSSASGNVYGTSENSNVNAGGLIGYNDTDRIIIGCYATGDVSGYSQIHAVDIGGFAGWNRGIIYDCYSTGNISAKATEAINNYCIFAGGFAGQNFNQIKNCYSTGSVTVDSNNTSAFIGGFIGRNVAEDSYGTILSNCYAIGDVTVVSANKNLCLGALVGYNWDDVIGVIIDNCYCSAEQKFIDARNNNTSLTPQNDGSETKSLSEIKTVTFHKDTLKLDECCWTFSDGSFPTLKNTSHNLVEHDGKEPTCAETGWLKYITCSDCSLTTYMELSKNHNMDYAADDTGFIAKCKTCNYSEQICTYGDDILTLDFDKPVAEEIGDSSYFRLVSDNNNQYIQDGDRSVWAINSVTWIDYDKQVFTSHDYVAISFDMKASGNPENFYRDCSVFSFVPGYQNGAKVGTKVSWMWQIKYLPLLEKLSTKALNGTDIPYTKIEDIPDISQWNETNSADLEYGNWANVTIIFAVKEGTSFIFADGKFIGKTSNFNHLDEAYNDVFSMRLCDVTAFGIMLDNFRITAMS